MKTFAIFAIVTIFAVISFGGSTNAQPVAEEIEQAVVAVEDLQLAVETAEPIDELEQHSRHKRATCDLLSKFGVNHSACAAHCLLKHYKGGYCNSKAVCVCRH